ncbi:MAG: 3-isopropylmalate dehydratase [Anaerolineae bacterium]|nr:3-isopropylmalate dehydratase [Anaerolineae bacterium]
MTPYRCWVYQDDVSTTMILPGHYTYRLHTPEDFAARALEEHDPAFAAGVQPGDVIVAGRNWGCGSMLEQAVLALKGAGIDIIIAASFNPHFFRNCITCGVQPILCPDLYKLVQTGDMIDIDLAARTIMSKDRTLKFPALEPSAQAILDAGGMTPMLEQHFAAMVQ